MPSTEPKVVNIVHVAVGVLVDSGGRVLITRRHEDQHQGGLWEFPGGKVESGETVTAALTRELREELAVSVTAHEPLLQVHHDYGDRQVLLDVYRITEWDAEPVGMEGQPLAWVLPSALVGFAFPEANRPIAAALQTANTTSA